MTQTHQSLIESAWEERASITAASHPEVHQVVESVISDLNAGRIRVAERQGVGQWTVNQWVKKAVLLSFRLNDNELMRAGDLTFFDKVKTKFSHIDDDAVRAAGVRIVPPAVARRGSYLARNVVLMPSFVRSSGSMRARARPTSLLRASPTRRVRERRSAAVVPPEELGDASWRLVMGVALAERGAGGGD